jgi:hypothetical protein
VGREEEMLLFIGMCFVSFRFGFSSTSYNVEENKYISRWIKKKIDFRSGWKKNLLWINPSNGKRNSSFFILFYFIFSLGEEIIMFSGTSAKKAPTKTYFSQMAFLVCVTPGAIFRI